VPLVLVSNNSELLRHLGAPSFRRLELEPKVASSGDEVWAMFDKLRPPLAILDAEMAGVSGPEADGGAAVDIPARVVWARQASGKTVAGAE